MGRAQKNPLALLRSSPHHAAPVSTSRTTAAYFPYSASLVAAAAYHLSQGLPPLGQPPALPLPQALAAALTNSLSPNWRLNQLPQPHDEEGRTVAAASADVLRVLRAVLPWCTAVFFVWLLSFQWRYSIVLVVRSVPKAMVNSPGLLPSCTPGRSFFFDSVNTVADLLRHGVSI